MDFIIQLLVGAIVFLAATCGTGFKLFYDRLLKAEETIEKLRLKYEELKALNGEAEAKVEMYENCPKRQDCPFHRGTAAVCTLAAVALCFLTSCTMPDVLYKVDYQAGVLDAKGRPVAASKDLAMLGGSLLTKTKDEHATLTHGDSAITRRREGKDELGVVRTIVQGQAAQAMAQSLGSVARTASNNKAAQEVAAQATAQTRITAPLEAQTEQVRIAAEAAAAQ
jgi:hypothetical protein